MVNNVANGYHPVRTLTKVRRQFLNKTPDINQLQNPTPAAIYQQAHGETYTIQASLGFFERGKRLFMGPEFLNIHFNVASSFVENRVQSKVVTLNLSANGNNFQVPWEQTIKRLESYGDLEFATWAHRIRNHQATYRNAMSSYYELLRSQDPEIQAMFRKAQLKAALACREIEDKYPFKKYLECLKQDTYEILSCSYSEGFLHEMGHTTDSFVLWAQQNGIPKIFEASNELYENIIKDLLNYVPAIAQTVSEGDPVETTIYDKDGCQKRVKARCISVFEPAFGTPLRHCYVILDKAQIDSPELNQQERGDLHGVKLKRRVSDFDEDVNTYGN